MIDTKKLREFASVDMWRHHSSHVVLSILDELDRVTEELGLAMGTLESRDRNIEAMAEEYRRVTAERDALKVDAERYVWLRDRAPWTLISANGITRLAARLPVEVNADQEDAHEMDVAIDAAIRASKGDS